MKFTFVFKESDEGIPTLIVYEENVNNLFGCASPKVINVITGKRATEIYNRLIDRAKETDHD